MNCPSLRNPSQNQEQSWQDRTEESATSAVKVPAFLNLKDCYKTGVQIATTIMARDSHGFGTGFEYMNGVIEIKKNRGSENGKKC